MVAAGAFCMKEDGDAVLVAAVAAFAEGSDQTERALGC